MAIYHYSASVIGRSKGKSAVAAAAYRSGEKIEDKRTGIIHDYTHKSGVDYSEIITPELSAIDTSWLKNRAELWNRVELSERRSDSQLAREIDIAIPIELDRETQIALVREYVQTNYVDRGMIADINLHHLDSTNPHAHVMLLMRELKIDEYGVVEFGNKNRDWNRKDLLIQQRQNWETLANQYLADAGYDQVKIDCRSLEAQGVDRIPQIHLGFHAASMRDKGVSTRIGDEYDRINLANAQIKSQLEAIYNDELAIVDLNEQCKKISTKINYLEAEIIQAAGNSARIREKLDKTKPPTSDDLIEMIGGDDRAKRIVQWCMKNMIIPEGQNEFNPKGNSLQTKMSAINIDSLAVAYIFTDTVRQDKLTINCKTSGEIVSVTGVVTGAIVGLIKNVDALAIQDAIISLRKPTANPEIDKVETPIPDRVSAPEIVKNKTTVKTKKHVTPGGQ